MRAFSFSSRASRKGRYSAGWTISAGVGAVAVAMLMERWADERSESKRYSRGKVKMDSVDGSWSIGMDGVRTDWEFLLANPGPWEGKGTDIPFILHPLTADTV